MNIYVGNLPFQTNDDDLRELFLSYGEVNSARVIMDRDTGRSRGFGFVEMDDSGSASEAIQALDNYAYEGRNLKVNEARPRENNRGGGGGGGRRDRW